MQQVPVEQAPLQHTPPMPQSALAVQAAHALFTQICPLQSAAEQQVPVSQTPAQHTCPPAQSEFSAQAWQLPPAQTWPVGQSLD